MSDKCAFCDRDLEQVKVKELDKYRPCETCMSRIFWYFIMIKVEALEEAQRLQFFIDIEREMSKKRGDKNGKQTDKV
jgi:DNA-directed RNA polymerase subunit RPC12/RpoP